MSWRLDVRPLSPARGVQLFFFLMAFASGLLGLTIFMFSMQGMENYPEFERLTKVTGQVTWARRGERSVAFQLEGDSRTFRYAKKGGEWPRVASSIADEPRGQISVLIDPNDQEKPVSGVPFFQVYEISKAGKPLRTYAQIRASWMSDYGLGYIVLAFMLFLAALSYRIGVGLKDESPGT